MRWLITVAGNYWSGGMQNNYCFSAEGGTLPKALQHALQELAHRVEGVALKDIYEPRVVTSMWVEVIQCP